MATGCRARDGPARQHHPDDARRVGGDAPARQVEPVALGLRHLGFGGRPCRASRRCWNSRMDPAGHRPHRLRQDHDAVHRALEAQQGRTSRSSPSRIRSNTRPSRGSTRSRCSRRSGWTFAANAARLIVRQDPDIIMIGEMRDLETAAHRHPVRAHRPPGAEHRIQTTPPAASPACSTWAWRITRDPPRSTARRPAPGAQAGADACGEVRRPPEEIEKPACAGTSRRARSSHWPKLSGAVADRLPSAAPRSWNRW